MKKIICIFGTLLIAILAIFMLSCKNNFSEKNIVYVRQEIESVKTNNQQFEFFDSNITYEMSYIDNGEVMPYVLLTPSTANDNTQIPLIVWLHGKNYQNFSKEEFERKSLGNIIQNSELANFNAYVICPQMKNKYYASSWCNEFTKTNLANLMDKFMEQHNIDQNKIIISGSSLGGQGAIYMAVNMTEYFDRAVIFSGYPSASADCSNIEIPAIGYIGTAGEDINSIRFMKKYFAKQVGEENLKIVNASHSTLPEIGFNLDENENGKSDIIEWMLSELD